MPAQELLSKAFPNSFDDVWQGAHDAVRSIGASITEDDPASGRMKARVSLSLWSWGEVIEVSVTPASAPPILVSVVSESRAPLTLADWGKNRRNVTQVIRQLEGILSSGPTRRRLSNQRSIAEELARLAALREKGALTEEEFETQKRAILARR